MGSWRDMEGVLARETVKSDTVSGVPNFHNIIPKGFRITVVENPLLPAPQPYRAHLEHSGRDEALCLPNVSHRRLNL